MGDHRLRHDLLLGLRSDRGRLLGDDELIRTELDAGRDEHVPPQLASGVRHRCLFGEQCDERSVPRSSLGQDGGDAVEALQEFGALGIRQSGVRLRLRTLLTHEQRDHLELGAVGWTDLAALCSTLDLTDGSGEHGDDANVVVAARAALRRAPGGLALGGFAR